MNAVKTNSDVITVVVFPSDGIVTKRRTAVTGRMKIPVIVVSLIISVTLTLSTHKVE